jgi:NitT/TauT family transport system ATP-binding protein
VAPGIDASPAGAGIAIRGVAMDFRNPADGSALRVLEVADLRIAPGEFVTLVGPSGCGKTTLLRAIDGLVAPSAGDVLMNGRPVRGPGPDRGFVFQYDSLLPWRTVLDNVLVGREIQQRLGAADREAARRYLRLVGLDGFERHYPHQLSGGMRQRVNLARALLLDPEVLLMDEPFAALDAQTREIMQAELLRIWGDSHKTVVFVTHQVDEAIFLSERVVVMGTRPGRVKAIVDVPFSRPRELRLKRTGEFGAIADHIWSLIEEEVRQTMLAAPSESPA